MSDENITASTTSDYSLNSQLRYLGNKTRAEFKGSYLNQDKITYTHGKIVKTHIVYETRTQVKITILADISYPPLENCLFGAVSLTKNVDIDKYKYSGYGIWFFSNPGEYTWVYLQRLIVGKKIY